MSYLLRSFRTFRYFLSKILIRREPNITSFMYVLSFLSRDVSAPGCFSPGSISLHKVSTSGRSVTYHIGPGTFSSSKFLSQDNSAPGVFGPGLVSEIETIQPRDASFR